MDIPTESKIYKYSERFSKADINSAGYKIAFCDLNVIIDWLQQKPDKQEEIITYFKNNNLRPVLNQWLIAELLQGLEGEEDKHVSAKKSTVNFLDKLKPLWILNNQFILVLEYLNCEKNINAHEYLKIFSNYPLGEVTTETLGTRSYDCDKLLRYHFIPYEPIVKKGGRLEAYIDDIIEENKLKDFQTIFKTGKKENVDAINNVKSNLSKLDRQEKASSINKINTSIVGKILSEYAILGINEVKVQNAIKDAAISQIPYACITDYIYYNIELISGLKDNKKGQNDFIDNSYAGIALSYCDYFITNEQELLIRCKSLKESLNTTAKLCKFDFKKAAFAEFT